MQQPLMASLTGTNGLISVQRPSALFWNLEEVWNSPHVFSEYTVLWKYSNLFINSFCLLLIIRCHVGCRDFSLGLKTYQGTSRKGDKDLFCPSSLQIIQGSYCSNLSKLFKTMHQVPILMNIQHLNHSHTSSSNSLSTHLSKFNLVGWLAQTLLLSNFFSLT